MREQTLVYTCVCTYPRVCVCLCVCICIYVYVCVREFVFYCVCMCVCVRACVCLCLRGWICVWKIINTLRPCPYTQELYAKARWFVAATVHSTFALEVCLNVFCCDCPTFLAIRLLLTSLDCILYLLGNKHTTLDVDSDSMKRYRILRPLKFTLSLLLVFAKLLNIIDNIFLPDSINASTKLWRDEDRPGQMRIHRRMTITSGFDVEVNISWESAILKNIRAKSLSASLQSNALNQYFYTHFLLDEAFSHEDGFKLIHCSLNVKPERDSDRWFL